MKEFPNDWQMIKNIKPKHFKRLSFDEMYHGFACSWMLMPGVKVVIRATRIHDQKVQERAFKTRKQALQFLKQLGERSNYEVFICEEGQTTHAFITDDPDQAQA
jgi:hypothetical protein